MPEIGPENIMDEYYHTKESVQEYIHLAEGINAQQIIDQLDPYLEEGSAVLELGSGPGTDWQILAENYEVTGSDLSKEFLNHLNNLYPEGDFVQINASTLQIERKFDCIFSNKVLHHLTDEELTQSIKRQYELLNEGGVICHSFWKGSGDEVFKGMYVNYHDKGELDAIFRAGFEVLLLNYYEEFEAQDSLFVIARKR